MDAMLKKFKEEREAKVAFITGLTDTAMQENRDLSDNEQELITRAKSRIGDIDKQLHTLSGDLELSQEAQDRLAKLGPAVNGGGSSEAVEYRSAGAYMSDYLATIIGEPAHKAEAEARLRKYHRAASHVTTAQFAGIFPEVIVGPLINFINASRPLVNECGVTPVPNGPSFRRPRLNDPTFPAGVDFQANQKDELVSQAFTITSDVVNLTTLGGYVNVARQVTDWGIASMDLIVNQLAQRYAAQTEKAAYAELAKSTGHVALPAGNDAAALTKAIYDAAAACYAKTLMLPDTILAGPLGWARLGSTSDLAGRPLFPFLAPANAQGQQSATSFQANPVGLQLVVSPAVTDDTFWVYNDMCLEVYEQRIGQLSVTEPSVLGTQVAYAGYVGFYRPAPDGAIHVSP